MVHDSLVCQLSDSTEAIIQRMTEGIQKLIKVHNTQGDEEGKEEEEESSIKINPAMKEHWELEIKILRDSPRDANKLRKILKVKQEEYEEAAQIGDIQGLSTEIEILKFVLCLVNRREEVKNLQRYQTSKTT